MAGATGQPDGAVPHHRRQQSEVRMPPHRRRRSRYRLSDWRIRTKLIAVLMVPSLAFIDAASGAMNRYNSDNQIAMVAIQGCRVR